MVAGSRRRNAPAEDAPLLPPPPPPPVGPEDPVESHLSITVKGKMQQTNAAILPRRWQVIFKVETKPK